MNETKAETQDKSERIAREALSHMLRAQVSLQVVKIGERNSLDMKLKEQHIQHLRLIQEFFERKYREMYGRDFVPIKEIVNP